MPSEQPATNGVHEDEQSRRLQILRLKMKTRVLEIVCQTLNHKSDECLQVKQFVNYYGVSQQKNPVYRLINMNCQPDKAYRREEF